MKLRLDLYQENSHSSGIICCHVFDCLDAGDEQLDYVMSTLRQRFTAGKVEEKCFQYIGFKIIQDNNDIIFDHLVYNKNLTT